MRLAPGADISEKDTSISHRDSSEAFSNRPLPSVHPLDLLIGIVGAVVIRLIVYFSGKMPANTARAQNTAAARWSA